MTVLVEIRSFRFGLVLRYSSDLKEERQNTTGKSNLYPKDFHERIAYDQPLHQVLYTAVYPSKVSSLR